MSAKKEKEIICSIDSEDALMKLLDRDYGKCLLIDVYLTWCGPCEPITENFRDMYFEYEDVDRRLEFYRIDSTLITDKKFLEKIGKATCKPKFVVIYEGEVKGVIEGADYPTIYETVDKYIPSLDQE